MLLLFRFTIRGHSMEPTFRHGSRVLASSIPYIISPPKVGDIVIVKKKTETLFVKRIQKVQKDRYFLIGDNPTDSLDSRQFGWVEKKDIIGKVIFAL